MAGMWKRTLVYLGLAEEDEEFEEVGVQEELPRREEPTQMVRTIRREDARRDDSRTRDDTHPAGRVVEPRIYDDAQEFADRLKSGVPVIINLRNTEPKHAPKILHFASGLVYGLNGRMQRVADQVFLITPFNVEVSADEKRRLADQGFLGEF
jgi:cell division inhibitor SepF